MSVRQLILRNIRKNLSNYYLYVFALIFSVALYFSFVTLQYDPELSAAENTVRGAAAIRAASVLLIAIVSVFLLYANTIFIKRRSKEIALFQLVGMTKGQISRILNVENFFLYFGSLLAGVLTGFLTSRIVMMIFYRVTGLEKVAKLHFSPEAFVQTLVVFSVIFLLIMLMNILFIRRQTILSLFRIVSVTENVPKRQTILEIIIGILGLVLIMIGYYVSTKLFSGDFNSVNELFAAMIFILGSVIIGTYFFYKGSVSFLFNLIRKRKSGYLNINEVLSLSSIMFRMKSNSLLLTVITTVSAIAIGLLSLSYISYYSAEKTAVLRIPNDFSLAKAEDAEKFKDALDKSNISYDEKRIEFFLGTFNLTDIADLKNKKLSEDLKKMNFLVVSDKSTGVDITEKQLLLMGDATVAENFMSLKGSGTVELYSQNEKITLDYMGIKEKSVLPAVASGALPVAVVDDAIYERLKQEMDLVKKDELGMYFGIDLQKKGDIEKSNEIFDSIKFSGDYYMSQSKLSKDIKESLGISMFVVGFLGLTFLITSGCILYFKQMDESEQEKPNYTILRKVGFTQEDLLKGIKRKQIFNFGIPLILGLSHSYFAVKSGWFLFGTELWTPMLIVMALYAALYSIFGMLSVQYYKKVIKMAL